MSGSGAPDGSHDDLDAIAASIAEQYLPMMAIGAPKPGRLGALARSAGPGGKIAGAALAVGTVAMTIVGMVRMVREGLTAHRPPDQRYRQLTGFGYDRSDADLAAVEGRVRMLVMALGIGGDSPSPDAADLVGKASRRLVRWVAEGRPDDEHMDATTLAYERLRSAVDTSPDEADEAPTRAAATAFVRTWRTATQDDH